MKKYDELIANARARADRLVGERALREEKLAKARRVALGTAFERFAETLGQDERARLFDQLKAQAGTKDAELIGSHPLRLSASTAGAAA